MTDGGGSRDPAPWDHSGTRGFTRTCSRTQPRAAPAAHNAPAWLLQSGRCSPRHPNCLSANTLLICKAHGSKSSPWGSSTAASHGPTATWNEFRLLPSAHPSGRAALPQASRRLFIEQNQRGKSSRSRGQVTANPGNIYRPRASASLARALSDRRVQKYLCTTPGLQERGS